MTVAFGDHGEVHVTNAQAFRILQAVGYVFDRIFTCDGEMELKLMLEGIQRARSILKSEDDLDVLRSLRVLVEGYLYDGKVLLTWA